MVGFKRISEDKAQTFSMPSIQGWGYVPRPSPNYILYPSHSLNRIKGVFIAYRRPKPQDTRNITGEMWFGGGAEYVERIK
jgi:hypothetical protein